MKLFKKLNQAGAAHFVVPAFVILVIGAIGTVVFIASHADTVTYSCDRGGTLSVTTCSYPATSTPGPSTTYASLCNSGDSSSTYNWNGTGGYHCAHLVSSVGLYGSCPSGQYKAYTYCYTIYRPYCSSGDTVSSDYSTCTHVASTTYSCAYPGDTLSGSTCSYPATATTTSTQGQPSYVTNTGGGGGYSCSISVPSSVKLGSYVYPKLTVNNGSSVSINVTMSTDIWDNNSADRHVTGTLTMKVAAHSSTTSSMTTVVASSPTITFKASSSNPVTSCSANTNV